MGALVPNPNDMEVINALNTLFSDPHLTKLRNWMSGAHGDPNLFASGRHLFRISYRLKVHPTHMTVTNPRGRWFAFLKFCLGERPYGAGQPTNHDIILSALGGFVDDAKCVGIHFWAQYGAGVGAGLAQIPSGFNYKAVVTQEPADPNSGQYWGSITLLCLHDLPAGAPTVPDPSAANGDDDNGESGDEQPNI